MNDTVLPDAIIAGKLPPLTDDQREAFEAVAWTVAEHMGLVIDNSANRSQLASIRTFLRRLGRSEVMDAADIALSNNRFWSGRLFRYFCGVCHNKIREAVGE